MMGLGLGLMRKLARRSSAIPNFGGVLLQHDGSTAANYSAGTNLSWSTEVYDTDTYHEAVTNPSRITIPSGVAYARLRSGIQLDSLAAAAGVGLQIQKNNSGSYAGRGRSTGTNTANTTGFVSTQTAILPVSAGDYFETRLTVSDSSVDLNASTSYFSLEKIESVRGCLLAHSGSTGVDGSALRTFSFTTETYDTDGLHEGVTNPSRITIPAGVEYARLSGCAVFNNVVSSSTCNVVITKNGSDDYVGVAQRVSVGGSGTTPVAWSVESPVIPVV